MASNPPYTSNLDATPTPNRRPNHSINAICTPRKPPTGVQSAIHLQSGRHHNTQQASKSAITKNLDAAPARKWHPIHHTTPIWTPRQSPTGVHSTIQPQSGRHANHPLASNPPYNSNLDATPTTHWRPIRHTTQIWTPPRPQVASIPPCTPKSGRRANHSLASISPYNPNLDAAPARKWRPPTNPRTHQSLRCHHLNRQSSKQGRWCTDGPQVSSLKPPAPQI